MPKCAKMLFEWLRVNVSSLSLSLTLPPALTYGNFQDEIGHFHFQLFIYDKESM